MYFRVVRNIFNASTKLSKQKINESTRLIFPTNLTVPKLSACIDQYSVQNYSTNKEQLEKHFFDEDSSNEQLDNDNEYDSDQHDGSDYQLNKHRPPQQYFIEKDQEKLDAMLKDNPELQRFKKIIELELAVLQQDGERVPSKLSPREWCEVLQLKGSMKRRKFYKFLFINEKVEERAKKEKLEKRLELEQIREERKNKPPSEGIRYGFGDNFMLRRISNMYMNHHLQWNALRAMMFGNKLVFDCSYDNYMSMQEAKSCAKQLNASYSANRQHDHPFEIFFTNVDRESKTMDNLHRLIPILYEPDFPITVTEKSYLELFDRSKLCYLSSDAPSMLEEYDPETIYIVGAFVDKGAKQRISFSKAKREGIRMAKLPLDKYVQFGMGSGKDLTLNQMCCIILDKQYKNWKEALKHVPTRKLQESRIRSLESKIRRTKMMMQDAESDSNDPILRSSSASFRSIDKRSSNESFRSSDKRSSYESFRSSDKRSPNDSSISSVEVEDFSHSARAKLRDRWNK